MSVTALDLFAGAGGWSVGARRLGIEEYGVEIMPAAIETREANGFNTLYNDVWDGLEHPEIVPDYNLLIASPPCQGYSMAGKGAGRKALDDVLDMIEADAYKDPEALRDYAEHGIDDRDVLVLTPLAYIWRDTPDFVALEQVPAVLPVWQAYAEVMREWGYSVEVANLQAEQYGVPQTRKRAILVASRMGEVALPAPTHSKYYSRTPGKLDEGVKKWVSMFEALSWGATRPAPTYCNSGHGGAGIEWGSNPVRKKLREQSLSGDGWAPKQDVEPGTNDAIRLTPDDAAAVQSFPPARGLASRPSPTITGGGTEAGGAEPIAKYHARYTSDAAWQGDTERLTTDEAADLQSFPAGWGFKDRPAVAVGNAVGRGLIGGSGAKATVVKAIEDGSFVPSTNGDGSSYAENTRITVDEAGALQSFPVEPPFIWKGAKTKQFLQIGNAVPPLLATHILERLVLDSQEVAQSYELSNLRVSEETKDDYDRTA